MKYFLLNIQLNHYFKSWETLPNLNRTADWGKSFWLAIFLTCDCFCCFFSCNDTTFVCVLLQIMVFEIHTVNKVMPIYTAQVQSFQAERLAHETMSCLCSFSAAFHEVLPICHPLTLPKKKTSNLTPLHCEEGSTGWTIYSTVISQL